MLAFAVPSARRRVSEQSPPVRPLRAQTFVVDGARFAVVPLGPAPLEGLSAAERAVAELAIAGCSNREIAQRRCVSTRTVDAQLASVYRKLGVASRAELAARR